MGFMKMNGYKFQENHPSAIQSEHPVSHIDDRNRSEEPEYPYTFIVY
jgi:hypothetical protein